MRQDVSAENQATNTGFDMGQVASMPNKPKLSFENSDNLLRYRESDKLPLDLDFPVLISSNLRKGILAA